MKKRILLLAYALIISSNFNITAMDERADALAIIQKNKGSKFNTSRVCQLFRSGNYNTTLNNEGSIGDNIKPFIAKQNNKEVCIYASNNNIKETISELTATQFCNGNIILMMDEPITSDIINITQLPKHITPIILCDFYQLFTYKNPVPSIPLISYSIENYSVCLAYRNTCSNNLSEIIKTIKKSEKTPNSLLAIDLDTTNNIQKEPVLPKKVTLTNQPYKYVPHAITLGLLLCIFLYKSGATEKLLRFLH